MATMNPINGGISAIFLPYLNKDKLKISYVIEFLFIFDL